MCFARRRADTKKLNFRQQKRYTKFALLFCDAHWFSPSPLRLTRKKSLESQTEPVRGKTAPRVRSVTCSRRYSRCTLSTGLAPESLCFGDDDDDDGMQVLRRRRQREHYKVLCNEYSIFSAVGLPLRDERVLGETEIGAGLCNPGRPSTPTRPPQDEGFPGLVEHGFTFASVVDLGGAIVARAGSL